MGRQGGIMSIHFWLIKTLLQRNWKALFWFLLLQSVSIYLKTKHSNHSQKKIKHHLGNIEIECSNIRLVLFLLFWNDIPANHHSFTMHFTADRSAQTEPRFHASFSNKKNKSQNSCLTGFLSFPKAQKKTQTTTKAHKTQPKNKTTKTTTQNPTKQKHTTTKKTQQTAQNKTNHQTQLCNAPSGTFLSPEATFCAEELEDCIFSIWNRKGITFLFNTTTKSEIAVGFSSTWNTSYKVISSSFSDNFSQDSKLTQNHTSSHPPGHETATLF